MRRNRRLSCRCHVHRSLGPSPLRATENCMLLRRTASVQKNRVQTPTTRSSKPLILDDDVLLLDWA